MSVEIKITPEAQALLQRLENPANALGAAARVMDYENAQTVGHIQRKYLSFSKGGPAQPDGLRVQTGLLRGSIRASATRVSGGNLISGIGSNVKYAAVHEFGFDGQVQVKSFARRNPKGDRYLFKGKEISRVAATRFGLLKKGTNRVPHTHLDYSQVKAHARHQHIKARAPIQTGIADCLPRYGAGISAAIVETWRGGKS